MIVETEIKAFPPSSRKASLVITSVIPQRAINALAERLGVEAGEAAEKALKTMKRNNMDLVQFRVDGTRIRIAHV